MPSCHRKLRVEGDDTSSCRMPSPLAAVARCRKGIRHGVSCPHNNLRYFWIGNAPCFPVPPRSSERTPSFPGIPLLMSIISPHYPTSWAVAKSLSLDVWGHSSIRRVRPCCLWLGTGEFISAAFGVSRDVNGYLEPCVPHQGHAKWSISRCPTMKLKPSPSTHFLGMSETSILGIWRQFIILFAPTDTQVFWIWPWFLKCRCWTLLPLGFTLNTQSTGTVLDGPVTCAYEVSLSAFWNLFPHICQPSLGTWWLCMSETAPGFLLQKWRIRRANHPRSLPSSLC